MITLHRRENFGKIREAVAAVRGLLARFPDLEFIWPVHPNPSVSGPVMEALSNETRVSLVAPLSYPRFIQEMAASFLILTDSGGVQEEAPALGVPVLVLRTETERPEGVVAGVSRLVGLESRSIISEVSRLLCDPEAYAVMAKGGSPYGDGRASDRIADVISSLALVRAA